MTTAHMRKLGRGFDPLAGSRLLANRGKAVRNLYAAESRATLATPREKNSLASLINRNIKEER